MFRVCALVVLSGIVILPSTVSGTMEVQAMKKSASSDHEKGVTLPEICNSQAARKTARFECIRGMENIFNTTKIELAKVPVRNKSLCQNISQHDLSAVETGHAATSAAWRALVDGIFHTIPKNHPLAFSRYRNAAIYLVENAVNTIFMAIATTLTNKSSDVMFEVQTLRNSTACWLRKLASKIYADIRKGQKDDPKVTATLECYRKKTVSAAVSSVWTMFDAFQILLSAISSEPETVSKDDLSSITVLSKKTFVNCEDWVQNIFDAIDLICPAYC